MIEVCIYGDEELDDRGKDLVERLKRKPADEYINELLGLNCSVAF